MNTTVRAADKGEKKMTMQSEHQKIKPVLDLARQLDIASNPDPAAIFEAGSGGFQVWCTPHDHPKGWEGIVMNSGAFSKPCEYVGSVHWKSALIWKTEFWKYQQMYEEIYLQQPLKICVICLSFSK
ncbi:MAG TPA: hypothetical protein DCY14_03690 [Anaerolineae bacterium]|nr:hypothetical protein [Anaerolineae bacterium]